MNVEPNNGTAPIGANIRDMINAAYEDTRVVTWQKTHANKIFEAVADQVLPAFEKKLTHFFNEAAKRPEDKRNEFVVDATTRYDVKGDEPVFSPMGRFQLPFAPEFTQLSAQDIKDLPGYIKIHEHARRLDMAVRLVGMTADDAKKDGNYSMPPLLILDPRKSYLEGAMDNSEFYPDLPAEKAPFIAKQGRSFSL